jgi:hypothetical protein
MCWRAAHLLIKQRGADAEFVATRRVDDMIPDSDPAGEATWKRILATIRELQCEKPDQGERINSSVPARRRLTNMCARRSRQRKRGGITSTAMADISKMRIRAAYLREQAKALRGMGDKAHHDDKLHDEFFELAQKCEAIADKIDVNIRLGIHRAGKPAQGEQII